MGSHHHQLEEVQRHMFQLHLSYLAQDDEPRRRALEKVVGQYLTMVPPTRRFSTPPVTTLFTAFSPHSTPTACQALEKYASNLLTYPWRPEYKVLKLYSGFFMHVLKRHQVAATALLQHMGYHYQDKHTMVMEEPIEPDRVARIALDCVIAFVECHMMIQISDRLQGKVTWEDIVKVRRSHSGTVDEAVRILSERRPSLPKTDLLVDVFDTNDVLYLPPPSQFSSPANKQTLWLSEDHKNVRPDTWAGNKGPKYFPAYPYGGSYPVDSMIVPSCHYCHHDIPSPPPPPALYHTNYLCENFQNMTMSGKRDSFYDNLSPEDLPPPSKVVADHRLLPKTPSKKKDNSSVLSSSNKKDAVPNGTAGSGDAKKSSSSSSKKWPCRFCTFLNRGDVASCEMCSLNRDTDPIVMGRECPQCTLINHKTSETCTACHTSLKDSPTYI